MSVAGIASYIMYGKQTNYSTPVSAGAGTRAFGMDQKVTTLTINNNRIDLADLNSTVLKAFAFGKFEGSLGVEWTLSTPWWIDAFIPRTSSTGAGPYTHTYDPATSVNAYTVEVGVNTTTPRVVQLQQLTGSDVSISTSINEPVRVRGNFLFTNTPSTSGTVIAGSIPSDDIAYPYTMVQATLENPSGTPLAEIQNMELNINTNIRHVYGPNSKYGVNAYRGILQLTGRFSATIRDNTWWNNVMARAEPANNTLKFNFTNGLGGTSQRSMAFTLTGLGLGQDNMSLDPNELVVEEVPFTARTIQVVAVNNTSVPP